MKENNSYFFLLLVSISLVTKRGRIACKIPDRNGNIDLPARTTNSFNQVIAV
jgi:hypothetical protein